MLLLYADSIFLNNAWWIATVEGWRRPGLVSDDLNTQLQPQANSFVCIYFSLLNKSVNKYGFGWLLLKLCICAPPRLPPSLAFTFCSSCNETLLSWVLLAYCVTAACWIVEDRCVCHANVSWYPSAYDTVSTLWEKPQTPAIKSTSVSNNNVLYVTRFYVGKICGEKKRKKNTMHHSSLKNTYRTSSRQR